MPARPLDARNARVADLEAEADGSGRLTVPGRRAGRSSAGRRQPGSTCACRAIHSGSAALRTSPAPGQDWRNPLRKFQIQEQRRCLAPLFPGRIPDRIPRLGRFASNQLPQRRYRLALRGEDVRY